MLRARVPFHTFLYFFVAPLGAPKSSGPRFNEPPEPPVSTPLGLKEVRHILLPTALTGKVMRSVVSVRPSIRHLFPLHLVNQLTFDLDYLPAKCTSSKIIVLERVLKRPINVLMFVLTDLGMPLNMTASSVLFFDIPLIYAFHSPIVFFPSCIFILLVHVVVS